MECLTIVVVLVLVLLVVLIAGLLTCIAVGFHRLMVARKCQQAGHKKERKIRYPINV
jgi:type II secretory pathway component PulK